MKKTELSPIELKKVVELRQLGTTWTEIERETKVERRAAKRAYEEWEGDKKMKEQEAARFRVMAEAFHEHLNDLIRLAEALINHLSLPSGPNDAWSAEEHLSNLWEKGILESTRYGLSQADRQRQIRSTKRLNLMIFKALQDHTHEKVRWQALDEWKKAWDTCKGALEKLREEANEEVRNLINQKPSLKEEVKRRIMEERDTVGRIISDVSWVVWWAGRGSKQVEKFEYRAEEGRVVAYFSDETYHTIGHRLSEDSLGLDMTEVCNLVFGTLYRNFTDKRIPEMLHAMEEKIEDLDDALEPFVLRPLLLLTRCELCPV